MTALYATICVSSLDLQASRYKLNFSSFHPSMKLRSTCRGWKFLELRRGPRTVEKPGCAINTLWKLFTLYNIKALAFITETESVYCAVRAATSNKIGYLSINSSRAISRVNTLKCSDVSRTKDGVAPWNVGTFLKMRTELVLETSEHFWRWGRS
jgi:hypothetical protein